MAQDEPPGWAFTAEEHHTFTCTFSVAGAKQLLKKLPIEEFGGLVSLSSRYYAERRWGLRRRSRLRQEPRPFRFGLVHDLPVAASSRTGENR